MEEVLRLENLQKSFGNVRALKNASFTLNEGEVVALLGDNGASVPRFFQMNGIET